MQLRLHETLLLVPQNVAVVAAALCFGYSVDIPAVCFISAL
jgi:hypothetical protein